MTLTVIAFALFAKFYSPQWLLWFVPLALLLPLPRWAWIVLVAHDLLSFVQFPVLFDALHPDALWYHGVVALRTLALVVLGIAVWRVTTHQQPSPQPQHA
jgi:hypothetical protein